MDRDSVLTACQVDGMIANGETIVIFEDAVLRLDSWIAKHPGGRLAILHMVGKDATDEMKAYHSARTLKTAKAFQIGKKPAGPWINRTPPIRRRTPRDTPTPSPAIPAQVESDAEDSEDDDASDSSLSRVSSQSSPPESTASEATSAFYSSEDGIGEAAVLRRRGGKDRQEPKSSPALSAAGFADLAVLQEIDQDTRGFPPVEPGVQEDIARKYRKLHQRVHDEGFYECRYMEYGKDMVRFAAIFAVFLVALNYEWYMTSAVFLGLFWHQIMFSAHDAGHLAITHNFTVDSLIGMFVADFCCGLSIGWWKSSHNVHHLITNQPEHDPDIQNVPLFATSPSFFRSIRSTYYDFTFAWDAVADILVPYQRFTYYPIMGIARFNLYLLSWLHVASAKSSSLGGSKAWWIRPTEIAFMACYWYIFGYCLLLRTLPSWTVRVLFVLVSHIVTMPLHVQITLSHWGMSTSELGESESFPQRQLRTTMDVDCPAWLDFIHGGLQFQAVHHLFPRVPRHNLRRLQVLVREFCDETGIPYSILSFAEGNLKVLGRLEEVSEQVRMMANCQKHMAETGESGLH